MDENDTPLSDRSVWQALADIDAKIDRVAGLGAQTVTHVKKLADLRSAEYRLGDGDRQNLRQVLPEILRVMSQLRESRAMLFARMTAAEIAAAFDKPRIDEARRMLRQAEDSGRTLTPKRDDSITLRVQIPVDASRKKMRKLAKEGLKALAVAGATWVLHHLHVIP